MPQIQHLVLFKIKPEVTSEKITSMLEPADAGSSIWLGALLTKAGGQYSSPEGLNQGYTHGFVMTFESVDARDAYLPHPEHSRVKAALLPCIDSVVAFDFELWARAISLKNALCTTRTIFPATGKSL